jgi:hypothetical protein
LWKETPGAHRSFQPLYAVAQVAPPGSACPAEDQWTRSVEVLIWMPPPV